MFKDIPIFVINCERDHDRLERMRQQFEAIQTAFKRIHATEKYNLTDAQRGKYSPFQARLSSARHLSDGEIACSYSHYSTWEQMVANKIPLALIMEDDVSFDLRLKTALAIAEKYQSEFDILNLRTDRHPNKVEKVIEDDYTLASFKKRPNRACAYFLTDFGAKRLLDYRFPIRMPVDDLLGNFRIHKLRVRGLFPNPIDLSNQPSSIWSGGRPKTTRHRGWRKIRSILRLFSSYY